MSSFKHYNGDLKYEVESAMNHADDDFIENLLLLERDTIDLQFALDYAFRNACARNHYKIVKMLLADSRIDPNYMWQNNINFHPFYLSVVYNNKRIMELLLADSRIDPSIRDNYALQYSASTQFVTIDSRRYPIIKILLKDERVISKLKYIDDKVLNSIVDVVKTALIEKYSYINTLAEAEVFIALL